MDFENSSTKTRAEGPSRSEAGPSHPQEENIGDQEGERPPQYSDTRATPLMISGGTSLRPTGSPLSVDFQKYLLPQSTLSPDDISTTTKQPSLYTDPAILSSTLREQAALPPKPLIQILGSHKVHGYNTITDFDLKCNLMPLLVRSGNHDQWNYLNLPETRPEIPRRPGEKQQQPQQPDSLESLAHRFCVDPVQNKSLTLSRRITNLDTTYLEGQIRALLSSLRYRGNVEITFPTTHSKVIVRKGNEFTETWLGRLNIALGAITGSKQAPNNSSYALEAVWPFATGPSMSGHGATGRECAVQSEVEWWAVWSGPLRNAVLQKRQGWVTVEDWTEVAMGAMVAEKGADWGIHDGHSSK